MSESTPPRELPVVAHTAWQAYLAMRDTKHAHYGFLERLEFKYEHGGTRTLAEHARLGALLAAHDRCVTDFAAAVKALGATDVKAHDALIRLMTEIGKTPDGALH